MLEKGATLSHVTINKFVGTKLDGVMSKVTRVPWTMSIRSGSAVCR